MEHEGLAVETGDGIATVWIDRPPVNALDQVTYRSIHAVFSDVNALDASVVVLAGRGRHFCAGYDLAEFRTMDGTNARERMFHVREAFRAVYTCEIPVIAAVHGAALGSGVAIAGSCDFVIAADDARFGCPEVGVGVMGGARHLARLVPPGVMRMMYFTADPLPALELQRFGGVLDVVPAESLMTTAREYAGRIVRHDPAVIRTAKRSLTAIEPMDLLTGYEFEQGLTVELTRTQTTP